MRAYTLHRGRQYPPVKHADVPAAHSSAPSPFALRPSPSGGLLSRGQKARLCILAREAFAAVHRRDPRDAAELEEFRHAEVENAVGKGGLTQCVQEDYKAVLGRFLHLKGEDGHAFKAHVAHATEPQRLAMHKLEESCRERGLAMAYPAAICRRQYRCELDQASAQQLWQLNYTVRSRRAKGGEQPQRRERKPGRALQGFPPAASPKKAGPAAPRL